MSEQTNGCKVNGGIIDLCKSLDRVLHPEANRKGLGAYLMVLSDLNTGETTRTGAIIQSGEFSKGGVLMNFCPFCGSNISSQFREEAGEDA